MGVLGGGERRGYVPSRTLAGYVAAGGKRRGDNGFVCIGLSFRGTMIAGQ